MAVATAFIGSIYPIAIAAQTWTLAWRDEAYLTDSVWDVASYELKTFSGTKRYAIFVGSSHGAHYGSVKIWDVDNYMEPDDYTQPWEWVRLFSLGSNTKVSFQGVIPRVSPIGPVKDIPQKMDLLIVGYTVISTSWFTDTAMLTVRLNSHLDTVDAYVSTLGSPGESSEVLYKVYEWNYDWVPKGFVSVGYTTYGSHYRNRNILVAFGDSTGRIVAACVFETPKDDIGMDLYEIDKRNFILVGYTRRQFSVNDTTFDAIVIRFNLTENLTCNTLWTHTYHIDGFSLIPYSIVRTTYIEGPIYHIIGTAMPVDLSEAHHLRGFVISLDYNGNILWNRIYDDPSRDHPVSLAFLDAHEINGNIIIAGAKKAFVMGGNLPRFIGSLPSVPLNSFLKLPMEFGDKPLLLRTNEYGYIIGGEMYSMCYDNLTEDARLRTVDVVDDSTVIAGGLRFNNDPRQFNGVYYYAVKDIKVGFWHSGGCKSNYYSKDSIPTTTVDGARLYVSTFLPPNYRARFRIHEEFPYLCGCAPSGEKALTAREGCKGGSEETYGAYEVYTSSGRLVKKGKGEVRLDDLPRGVYIIRRGDRIRALVK